MIDFARTLSQPILADAVAGAETVAAPTPYHFKSNLRREYGAAPRWPERFVVSGDAACSFNPIYGQGMTAAALGAEILHDLVEDRGSLDGVARRFQTKLDRMLDQPWMAALASDLQFPEVTGPRSPVLSFAATYSNLVLSGMHRSSVQRRFLPVLNMTAGPLALFHPTLMASAFLTSLGVIKPNPTYPGPRDSSRKVLPAMLAG